MSLRSFESSHRFQAFWTSLAFVCVLALGFLGLTGTAFAQEDQSGALDFGLDFHYSMHERSVLGVHARAMAVDRVPGTMVGRFGEMYASLGVGLDGGLVEYSLGLKLGVGLGVKHFVFFVASGLMVDSYTSVSNASKSDEVKPGLGIPIALGFWIDPTPGLYFYLIAEPSWSLFAGGTYKTDENPRRTTPYLPFSFAWELSLRGGIGFDLSKLHMRIDYTYHQVEPCAWHIISLGFGFSSASMTARAKEPVLDD